MVFFNAFHNNISILSVFSICVFILGNTILFSLLTNDVYGDTVDTINTGTQPYGISVNENNERYYAVGQVCRCISVYDVITNDLLHTISVGSSPVLVPINEITKRAYVANAYSSTLSIIDIENNEVIHTLDLPGSGTADIAVNSITNQIYISNINSDSVTIVNGVDNSVMKTIDVGNSPFGIEIDEFHNIIYVANFYDQSISVIDGTTNTVTDTISAGVTPRSIVINETTKLMYVTNEAPDTVSVIDIKINEVIHVINVGNRPFLVDVNEITNLIYVADRTDDTVSVIDGKLNKVIHKIPVGNEPAGVSVNESTNTIYVTNTRDHTISIIDGDQYLHLPLPEITVPEFWQINATSNDGTIGNYPLPSAKDYSELDIDVECVPIPAALFSIGNSTINCISFDDIGQNSTKSFILSVRDTTKPTIQAPENRTFEIMSKKELQKTSLGSPVVTDLIYEELKIANNAPDIFDIGETEIVWKVTDGYGNEGQDKQNILFVDKSKPSISVITPKDKQTINLDGHTFIVDVEDQIGRINSVGISIDDKILQEMILQDKYYRLTKSNLSEGEHSLFISAIDEFGNTQKNTSLFSVTIPTVQPEDSDHDGIADHLDSCPLMPENYNGFEDTDGCPDIKPESDLKYFISVMPKNIQTSPGSEISATVNIAGNTSGISQDVSLSCSVSNPEITCTVLPDIMTSEDSANLSINIPDSTSDGAYEITVTGTITSNEKTASDTLLLIVSKNSLSSSSFLVTERQQYTIDPAKNSIPVKIFGKISDSDEKIIVTLVITRPDGTSDTINTPTQTDGFFEIEYDIDKKNSMPGTYTIDAKYLDDMLDSVSFDVKKTGKLFSPTPSFTLSPESIKAGMEVGFDASESSDTDGEITKYAWNFGDGNKGTGKTVSHIYKTDDVFTVKLVITDNDGLQGNIQDTITVTKLIPDPEPVICGPGTKIVDDYCQVTKPEIDFWQIIIIVSVIIGVLVAGFLLVQYVRKDKPFDHYPGTVKTY